MQLQTHLVVGKKVFELFDGGAGAFPTIYLIYFLLEMVDKRVFFYQAERPNICRFFASRSCALLIYEVRTLRNCHPFNLIVQG